MISSITASPSINRIIPIRFIQFHGAGGPVGQDKLQIRIDELNAASAHAGSRGLRLGYHNHFWEWRALEAGSVAFDELAARLDPAVELELDIYWARTAGRDPSAEIARHGSRVTRLHLKDGPADQPESPMTALGDGAVDLRSAMRAAKHADFMLVELDQCATSMREAVRRSAEWLGLKPGP